MRPLVITALFLLFVIPPVWAQSGSPNGRQQPAPTAPPQSESPSSGPADSTKLEPIEKKPAIYPPAAIRQELQGEVWVKFDVSESGKVENVSVISGDPILADAAVDAIKKWKFKPFIKNGKPVRVSSKLPFDFHFGGKDMDKGISADRSTTSSGQGLASASQSQAADKGATPTPDEVPKRLRVSQGVSNGLLIHQIAPVYPPQARRDRIQGTVILRAIIGKDGRIANLTPISGPAELIPAAVGAVQQWRYKPYILLGQPVEVETQITVNFQLAH